MQYCVWFLLLSRCMETESPFCHACLNGTTILKSPLHLNQSYLRERCYTQAELNARRAIPMDRESRGESSLGAGGAIFSDARDACPIRRMNK